MLQSWVVDELDSKQVSRSGAGRRLRRERKPSPAPDRQGEKKTRLTHNMKGTGKGKH